MKTSIYSIVTITSYIYYDIVTLSGWWYTYPPEKYESQIGMILPNYWGK